MTDTGFVAGIDLGGTKILTICLDESLEVVSQDLRPTEADSGLEAVIGNMIQSLEAAAAGRPLRGIGVSTPGPCNPDAGIVTTPPNLPGWRDVPLASLLQERLGLPCWIENDGNAAAIGEHRLGAGRGSHHMVFVTLGTGVGGGLILNDRIYHGASGGAGEIGHMQLAAHGPLCGCGRPGCLEALASGVALGRQARTMVEAEPDGILARLVKREGGAPDARSLSAAAEAGDATAIEAIVAAGLYLGAGLTNLVDILNPEVIVIGGGLRKLGEPYIGTAREVVRKEAFAQHYGDVRIVEAELGDEAPAIGAALVALDKLT